MAGCASIVSRFADALQHLARGHQRRIDSQRLLQQRRRLLRLVLHRQQTGGIEQGRRLRVDRSQHVDGFRDPFRLDQRRRQIVAIANVSRVQSDRLLQRVQRRGKIASPGVKQAEIVQDNRVRGSQAARLLVSPQGLVRIALTIVEASESDQRVDVARVQFQGSLELLLGLRDRPLILRLLRGLHIQRRRQLLGPAGQFRGIVSRNDLGFDIQRGRDFVAGGLERLVDRLRRGGEGIGGRRAAGRCGQAGMGGAAPDDPFDRRGWKNSSSGPNRVPKAATGHIRQTPARGWPRRRRRIVSGCSFCTSVCTAFRLG